MRIKKINKKQDKISEQAYLLNKIAQTWILLLEECMFLHDNNKNSEK